MVDHLIAGADVTEKAVSKEELFAEDELPSDFAQGGEKPAAKKAKKAAKSDEAQAAPADAVPVDKAPAKPKAASKQKSAE